VTIEAVIFDLGGVILDIDYVATVRAFEELFGSEGRLSYSQQRQSSIFDELETGRVSPDAFYATLARELGRPLDPAAIDLAWNAMLGEIHPPRIDFIRKLGRSKRLFLLSNTNIIHKTAVADALQRPMGGVPFDSLFEAAYYSHEIGLRKPDVEVFRFVLDRHGLKPQTTLFIDDSLANIEGAKKTGLQVHHLRQELLDDEHLRHLLEDEA
jgi:HAD superfamily hydrolase (TIGR01509 family)